VLRSVNSRKSSPIRKFLQRHPMIRAIALTIVFSATLALAGALISWIISYIPGNKPGPGPIPPVYITDTGERTDSPSPSPAPSPYSNGSCLAGNFTKTSPDDINEVPCSSAEAEYQVIETFPDETDLSVCRKIPGAKLEYSEEYTENGIPISSYVYCLGRVS
jgi:hypothetical protein